LYCFSQKKLNINIPKKYEQYIHAACVFIELILYKSKTHG
jgi:hypothetical protein